MSAQAPLDLVIDTNERDIEIESGISGTKIVLFGATPSGKRDIIILLWKWLALLKIRSCKKERGILVFG